MLRLLQHLVKFGYYNDMDDVKQLLTPLLSLLDGAHDVPFPKDKAKGNCVVKTFFREEINNRKMTSYYEEL